MPQRLHHTSFTVSDVDAAEKFFVENFGMTRLGGGVYDFDYLRQIVGYSDARLKIAVLGFASAGGAGHKLELIEYLEPRDAAVDTATNRPGAAHLCLEVEDIQADYERLRSRGVQFKSAPVEVAHGINRRAWAVYFSGPDNIALELFQPAATKA